MISTVRSPLAVFVVGLLSGGTAAVVGFGIGSLLTPLLTLRMTPDLAVARSPVGAGVAAVGMWLLARAL